MKENIVKEKSFEFALEIIKICKDLVENREYIMSKQLIRSGTAIGALVREAEHAESKKDFIHKLSISLKEANETEYWLELLFRSEYISKETFELQKKHIVALLKLLISIINAAKRNLTSGM